MELLWSEEWWINLLCVVITTIGTVFASAILIVTFCSRKIVEELARHERSSGYRSADLSMEQANIFKLTSQIGDRLSREHTALHEQMGVAVQELRALREEGLEAGNRQQMLSAQQLDIKQMRDHIAALLSSVSYFQSENQFLRQRNSSLTQANEQLTRTNRQLMTSMERPPEHTKGGEHDWEPDF